MFARADPTARSYVYIRPSLDELRSALNAVGASGNIGRPASRKQEGRRHLTASPLSEHRHI